MQRSTQSVVFSAFAAGLLLVLIELSNSKSDDLILVSGNFSYECWMSAIYTGYIIGRYAGKRLVVEDAEGIDLVLNRDSRRKYVRPAGRAIEKTVNISNPCENVGKGDVKIDECPFPQWVYTSSQFGPLVRREFQFNAANIVGNLLFAERAEKTERSESAERRVVASIRSRGVGKVSAEVLSDCFESPPEGLVILNLKKNQPFEESRRQLDEMINSKFTIFSAGSGLGFFGQAINGNPGFYVSGYSKRCIKLMSSQSGSLEPWYAPKKFTGFTTNNHLRVCGPNAEDVRLFVRNLL